MTVTNLLNLTNLRFFGKGLRPSSKEDAINPYLIFYEDFVTFIKRKFDVQKFESETNEELLKRIRELKTADKKSIQSIETFLNKYNHARFGFELNEKPDLREAIKQLK